MSKSDYKKVNDKSSSVQDRLYYKGIYCISDKWIRWFKRYMNRAYRRKVKEEELNRQQQWQRKIERFIGKSGIKERFLVRTFNNFVVTDRNKKATMSPKTTLTILIHTKEKEKESLLKVHGYAIAQKWQLER